MITRCPQCQTSFRVASQQLAARQGLLRCGHCAAVFNGFTTLGRDENEALAEARTDEGDKTTNVGRLPGPVESAQAPVPGFVGPGQSPSEITQSAQKNSRWRHLQGRLDDAPPLPVWTPASDRQAEPVSDDTEHAIASRPVIAASPPFPTSRGAEIANGVLPSSEAMQAFADSLADMDASEASAAAKDKPVADEGKPQAHAPRADPILFRPDLYERPQAKRGSWLAALLLLGLLLAAQAIYFLRSDIAAQWPPLKSSLAALCRPFGCQVSLPRQIDQLTIEASELQADPGRLNVVSVTAIIRNRGTTAQAYPILEITLTDTLDRPLARRSLDAVDYSPEAAQRQEGIAAGAEVIAKTAIETPHIKPSGYRLRLYYR